MWKDILTALSLQDHYKMRIGTGYLNLVRFFRNHLMKIRKSKVDFICAAPEANAFLQTKSFKRFMPPAIRMNIFRYAKENTSNVNFYEYKRRLNLDGDTSLLDFSTYHMKGTWLS